jgi:hypothetical protein
MDGRTQIDGSGRQSVKAEMQAANSPTLLPVQLAQAVTEADSCISHVRQFRIGPWLMRSAAPK